MSKATKTELELMIDVLRAEAAEARAWAAHVQAEYPWRQHDFRIYTEREIVALQAILHLEEGLEAVA